jgi:hypothetical protein
MKRTLIAVLTLLALTVGATSSFAAFAAGVPIQGKVDILAGGHNDADSYKCALYVQANATTMNSTATTYSTTGEIANGSGGTAGYTAGGVSVTRSTTIASGTKAVASFANCVFTTLTTPSGGVDAYVIYNTTNSNKIIYIGALGSTSSTNSTLTVTMPTQDSTTGLIRLP